MNRRVLFSLNDPPYGSERVFNGLRNADGVAKRGETEARIFLMGDAVVAVMASRHCRSATAIPTGYSRPPDAEPTSAPALAESTPWAEQVVTF